MLLSVAAYGQSTYLNKALSEVASDDFQIRADGMAKLSRDDTPAAKEALIDLLDKENRVTAENYRTMGRLGDDAGLGEDYAEYDGWLGGVVMKIAENPRYSRALSVLVRSSCDPDTACATWLARHGEQIVPDVIQLAKTDLDLDRYSAMGLSSLLIQYERAGKFSLQPDHRAALKGIIIAGLSENSGLARAEAVTALGEIGDQSDIERLRKLAVEDPIYDTQNKQFYNLHKEAAEAIAKIERRGVTGKPVK
jgi:HEAT repeat protein